MSCCGPLIGTAMDAVARRIAVKKALKSIEVRMLIIRSLFMQRAQKAKVVVERAIEKEIVVRLG